MKVIDYNFRFNFKHFHKFNHTTKTLITILVFLCLITPLCAQNNTTNTAKADNSTESTIPQGILDFRRFEIITLGALPFITLDVTLGYSMFQFVDNRFIKGNSNYAFPNPFKTSGNYNTDEMKAIIITSVGICIGIGINDLIFNIIRRNKIKLQNTQNTINITPIEEDPDAIKIEVPSKITEEDDDSEVIFLDNQE